MGDMVDGLRCIAAHRQRSRLAKIVCTSTTLPPDLDDLLAYLRVTFLLHFSWQTRALLPAYAHTNRRCLPSWQESTDLRGLCLTDVPVSLSQARALAGLLIEAKLEELILDSNGLSNASLAVICRAAQVLRPFLPGLPARHCLNGLYSLLWFCAGPQVQMSLTRLGIRNNTLDQAQAGHEMGDLLCNSGYLKVGGPTHILSSLKIREAGRHHKTLRPTFKPTSI